MTSLPGCIIESALCINVVAISENEFLAISSVYEDTKRVHFLVGSIYGMIVFGWYLFIIIISQLLTSASFTASTNFSSGKETRFLA